eukprot:362355-Chlamydomonas_euryale.AAC.15
MNLERIVRRKRAPHSAQEGVVGREAGGGARGATSRVTTMHGPRLGCRTPGQGVTLEETPAPPPPHTHTRKVMTPSAFRLVDHCSYFLSPFLGRRPHWKPCSSARPSRPLLCAPLGTPPPHTHTHVPPHLQATSLRASSPTPSSQRAGRTWRSGCHPSSLRTTCASLCERSAATSSKRWCASTSLRTRRRGARQGAGAGGGAAQGRAAMKLRRDSGGAAGGAAVKLWRSSWQSG